MTGASQSTGCVFCEALTAGRESPLVVFRGTTCYVLLNLYPYNSGHLMIIPVRHVASLAAASTEERAELMELTRRAELALTEACQPHGMNVGINLGRSGGAGIIDHLHIHVVPRWNGDTNFMTVLGETRVLPEELEETAGKLRPIFERLEAG